MIFKESALVKIPCNCCQPVIEAPCQFSGGGSAPFIMTNISQEDGFISVIFVLK